MENNSSFNLVGVVGLGLMGSSVVAALLLAGNKVVALAPVSNDLESVRNRIKSHLVKSYNHGVASEDPIWYLNNLTITKNYADLKDCSIVMECVIENIPIKKAVYEQIENNIVPTAVLATNTSAIPVTVLKDYVKYPTRFLGMHWAEPAFTTKFLEIVCSPDTDITIAEMMYHKATSWGKEPTLIRKDIRGFITNRIMYAMYREAFFLVENGYASIEDVDRTCRNDAGQWMPFCGLFRYMDLTGLQAYYSVMKDLFPTLNNQSTVPQLIKEIAEKGGNGVTNGVGFYQYTKEEAEEWTNAFEEFSFEIRALADKYPSNIVKQKIVEQVDVLANGAQIIK
jgi:3-hydroxybutyryl-CoA dehydrogenase